jgi:hypothetical protein
MDAFEVHLRCECGWSWTWTVLGVPDWEVPAVEQHRAVCMFWRSTFVLVVNVDTDARTVRMRAARQDATVPVSATARKSFADAQAVMAAAFPETGIGGPKSKPRRRRSR